MRFRIDGKAVPKGRPRVTSHGAYTPERTKEFEQRVWSSWMMQSRECIPEGKPVSITVKVHFKVPDSKSKKAQEAMVGKNHIHRPDLDNIIKSITDALNGFAYHDDSQICNILAFKVWGTEDYTEVLISEAIGGAI